MKILLVANSDGALIRFRAPLIKAFVSLGYEVYTLSPKSIYFDALAELGAKCNEVHLDRHSLSVIGAASEFFQMYRSIKNIKPDVVHSFTHKPSIFASIAAGFLGVNGIYSTITGLGAAYSNPGVKFAFARLMLEIGYRLAGRFMTTCFFQNEDDMAEYISKRILPINKSVLTAGSGVDMTEFVRPTSEQKQQFRRTLSIELGCEISNCQFVVLFNSRGVLEKGIVEFYSAARILNELYPRRYCFVHAGLIDVDSRTAVNQERVIDLVSSSGVNYIGFKENISDYISASDVVVLPSVYREGTPRSLIEALSLGKVIITTNMPGCKSTVYDGWNGFICSNSDVNSVVSCLLKVTKNFVNLAEDRSESLCRARFCVDKLIKITLNIYHKSGS